MLDLVIENTEKAAQMLVNNFATISHHGLTSARLLSPTKPTLAEWTRAAGLDWHIEQSPVMYKHQGNVVESDNNKVLMRSDTGFELGILSNKYKPVNPSEVMHFFSDLIEDHGFKMIQAGYADGGKKIYAYAQCGGEWEVAAGDKTLNNLLLMTSSDGSSATLVQPFVESLYCLNQLPMVSKMFSPIKVRHSSKFDAEKVKIDLGIYDNAVHEFAESLKALAKKNVGGKEALSIIYKLLAKKDNIEDESRHTVNLISNIYSKFKGQGIASQREGRKDTLWGLLNAVTEYTDHDMASNDNNRWKSKVNGAGSTLKQQAYEYINDICNETVEIELIKGL